MEGALLNKLQEYKNPIVIVCFGVLIGTTFYFKNIDLIYLAILCLTIVFLLFYFKNKATSLKKEAALKLLALIPRGKPRGFSLRNYKKILLLITFILFGYFYTFYYFKLLSVNLDYLLNKKCIYIGEILSQAGEDSIFYKKYLFQIKKIAGDKVKNINATTQVIGSTYEEYEIGDIVQVSGKLKLPKSAILPGLFDERRYLFSRGIRYILKAEPGTLVFLDSPGETSLKKVIVNIRNKLLSINSKHLSQENLAIVNGILLGSKASKLPYDLKDKIQNLGLSHITSASGFNVSVLIAGIFYILHLFKIRGLTPIIISSLAALLYCIIADFSSSILRATAFIILVLLGNIFEKKLKILPALCLILLVFFIVNPINILDIGLQLSILAFLGLVLFVNEITPKYPDHIKWLATIFFQSLFAQIMVLPLIVFYFHNIQLLGLISNLAAVPIASIILILSILNIFFLLIPPLGFVISLLLQLFSNLLLFWVNFLDKISFKQIFLPNINFYVLILIYIFIIYVLCLFFMPLLRVRYKVLLLTFTVIIITLYTVTDTSKYLKIFCIPKYNNEGTLIVPPNEKPVYISLRINENDQRELNEYLRLNNLPQDFIIYSLDKNSNNLIQSHFIQNVKNKIEIKYKNFSFEIIKNYIDKIISNANCIKLPILRKSDPNLSTVLSSHLNLVIVNDYKKLSKKSKKDITWLKAQAFKSLFLSETGTITIISNGNDYKLDFSNE